MEVLIHEPYLHGSLPGWCSTFDLQPLEKLLKTDWMPCSWCLPARQRFHAADALAETETSCPPPLCTRVVFGLCAESASQRLLSSQWNSCASKRRTCLFLKCDGRAEVDRRTRQDLPRFKCCWIVTELLLPSRWLNLAGPARMHHSEMPHNC